MLDKPITDRERVKLDRRAKLVRYAHLCDNYKNLVIQKLKEFTKLHAQKEITYEQYTTYTNKAKEWINYYDNLIAEYELRIREITLEIKQIQKQRETTKSNAIIIGAIALILMMTGLFIYLDVPARMTGMATSSVANLTVENAAPTVTDVILTPSAPNTTNNITCSGTTSDANSDTVTAYYKWYIDGELNSSFNNIQNISSDNTTAGQYWICEITPFDGTVNGTPANSTSTKVSWGAIPPAPNNTNVTMVGDTINITWTDQEGPDNYSICFTEDLDTAFTDCITVTTTYYLDTNASQYRKRFYMISSVNELGQNVSDIFGKQNYTLKRKDSSTTRNLIGLYLNASYLSKAQNLLNNANNATVITKWDAQRQAAITCNDFTCPTICTSTTCNFNLTPGEAYRIEINESAATANEWTMIGKVYTKANVSLYRNSTHGGINWVAMYGNTSLANADALMNSIGNVDSANRWNAATQTWTGRLDIGLPFRLGTNFAILPDEGYSIIVRQNVNWTQQ